MTQNTKQIRGEEDNYNKLQKQMVYNKQMSLFPEENILTKEIESWKGFASSLEPEDDRKSFLKMLNDCQKYALAINAKETPFPTEPLIMALLLAQHKMIRWLARQTKSSQIPWLKENPRQKSELTKNQLLHDYLAKNENR